jgi:hypothetical protein
VSDLDKLDAYLTREMMDTDADAFEESLFDAPDDPHVAFVDRLARHGRTLVEHGTFDMGVTRAHIDALIAAGHKVHVFDAGPPDAGAGTVTFDPSAELMATLLRIGRTDLTRVDVEITVTNYNVTKTIKDVLVDPSDGVIYGLCERPLAEIAFGAGPTVTRVRRVDGAREVIATWHLAAAAV